MENKVQWQMKQRLLNALPIGNSLLAESKYLVPNIVQKIIWVLYQLHVHFKKQQPSPISLIN